MNSLYNQLKKYSINDCYALEEESKEYAILSEIFENINNKELFLPLILSNAVVCYSLSKSGIEYWEEISDAVKDYTFTSTADIYLFFIDFLPRSSSNEKSVKNKISKLKKLKIFLDDMYFKQKYYHKNMLLLSKKIAECTQSLFDDLIVTYAVKMYAYGARVRFGKRIEFPYEFLFVLDSKLEALYERYDGEFPGTAKDFYFQLAEKIEIPPMHLKLLLVKDNEELIKMDISHK